MEHRLDASRHDAHPSSREVSLSVEETNRLRASLGLKPLRTRSREANRKSSETQPSTTAPQRHQHNVSDFPPAAQLQQSDSISPSAEKGKSLQRNVPQQDLQRRLQQVRRMRLQRAEAVGGDGVLSHDGRLGSVNRADVGDGDGGDSRKEGVGASSHVEELARWVQREREREVEMRAGGEGKGGVIGSRWGDGERAEEGERSIANGVHLPDGVQEGDILTLRDKPVLDGREVRRWGGRPSARLSGVLLESDEDDDDVDAKDVHTLEDASHGKEVGPRAGSAAVGRGSGEYDPTDNSEFLEGRMTKVREGKELVSVARADGVRVLADYRAAKGEQQGKVQSIMPRRRQQRPRKKRRREVGEMAVPTRDNVVSRGHVEALRRAADSSGGGGGDMGWGGRRDDEDDDDDDDYVSRLRARQKKERVEERDSVRRVMEAIKAAEVGMEGDGGSDGEEAVQRGAQVLYDEMQAFLQRVPSSASAESSLPKERLMNEELQESDSVVDGALRDVHEDAGSGSGSVVRGEADDEEGSLLGVPEVPRENGIGRDSERNDGYGEEGESVKTSEETEHNALSGVAGILKSLRETGQLTKKQEQSGRARDKRRKDASDSEGEQGGSGSKVQVRLAYTDDNGNELTPKEAFRLLCHKFHGNGPGKNKTEKRLKKLLDKMRVQNMHADDTPLASAAALKKETKKLNSAHVVLSGADAFVHVGGEDDDAEMLDHKGSKRRIEEKVEFTLSGGANNPVQRRRR